MPAPDHRVDSSQEPDGSFDATFGPAQLILHRRGKENKQACSIGTKSGNHFVRIDPVAQTLGHRLPFIGAFYPVRHHSLSQQFLYWLVEVNQAQVAHELCPEARVDQMHYCMRIATDVLVHGSPLFDDLRIKWSIVIVGIAVAKEVP